MWSVDNNLLRMDFGTLTAQIVLLYIEPGCT